MRRSTTTTGDKHRVGSRTSSHPRQTFEMHDMTRQPPMPPHSTSQFGGHPYNPEYGRPQPPPHTAPPFDRSSAELPAQFQNGHGQAYHSADGRAWPRSAEPRRFSWDAPGHPSPSPGMTSYASSARRPEAPHPPQFTPNEPQYDVHYPPSMPPRPPHFTPPYDVRSPPSIPPHPPQFTPNEPQYDVRSPPPGMPPHPAQPSVFTRNESEYATRARLPRPPVSIPNSPQHHQPHSRSYSVPPSPLTAKRKQHAKLTRHLGEVVPYKELFKNKYGVIDGDGMLAIVAAESGCNGTMEHWYDSLRAAEGHGPSYLKEEEEEGENGGASYPELASSSGAMPHSSSMSTHRSRQLAIEEAGRLRALEEHQNVVHALRRM